MAKKPCDCDSGKMTFQQWAAAGGAVPMSYRGREKAWANQVKKYAAGGSVSPAAQIDGDEFVEAAKAYGLSTDNDTLNKIVARVNRGESVREAAKAVAQSRSSGEAKMQAGGIAKLAKMLKGTQETLPAAQREANLQKMLSESKVQQRLYHGTMASEGGKGQEAIRRIKPSKEGALGSGVYLTPQSEFASTYAGFPARSQLERDIETGSDFAKRSARQLIDRMDRGAVEPHEVGGNMLPVYAQMKNPLVLEGKGDPMIEALIKLGMDESAAGRMVENAYERKGYIGKEVESRARAAGYDGLMQYRDGNLSEVVSYNPSAVKSAIGNKGTYDTSKPDLNEAKGGAVHMADGGKVDKPYIGYRRAGRRPESQQDRAASANIPVAVARGLVSGTLGMPGDLESLARLPYELITGKESPTILPTSGDIEKRLPFRGASQTPVGQMFTGASQLAGGAYTGPGSGARAVMAVPKAIKRAGQDFVQAAGQPAVNVIKPKGGKIPIARTQEEQDVINKFGQKQEQEAARAKKVEKLAQESAGKSPEDQATKTAKSKGKRVKVDADFYRKMAEDKGEAEVLRSARAGEHLKPTPGGYVGAPRTVTSGQALGGMRRAMDKDFQDSVQAVRLADPDRLGTWYDRAKQGIAESTEPYQLPRTLEQHGVYSAGVSPESELGFALKHLNSRVAGEPAMAYRGAPMRNLDTAVAEDRPANMGFKIGEYANKNDPRIPNAGLFGVNDFRRAQGMGYTDPQGNPWKAGVSETMHPFMDAETALQVDRANKAGTGGRTDWAGPHIQEVPWVYGKAQDIHSRGKRGRFGGDELEGIKSSLREANNTARDYMYKHAASATHEAIPGASLGHVRQALDMTPEAKLAYGREGRWDLPAPEYALSDMPEVGAGNRDVIYSAMGYRQLPSREAQGLYMNKLGGVETNPMTIARPLMDFPTGGGGGRMADESSRMMDVAEQTRALIDAQEAGAYNLPNTLSSVKGKNSMVLDTRGMNPNRLDDPTAGVLPTSEQLAKMGELMGDYGFGVTATNRGAVAFPFDSSMDPKAASSAFRKTGKQMQEIFPSSQEKAITSTGYVPGVGKRSPEGPLSTAPYSGEATSDLLKAYAELPQSVALNVSESEAFRNQVRAKALRDSKMGGTRGDIQETRRFFSEADWPRAVEMIRRGMTPAAALAALGYSASSMAGQER